MRILLGLALSSFLLSGLFFLNSEQVESSGKTQVQEAIKQIFKKLQKEQWRTHSSFIPPLSFDHQKGLYSSIVKANIIDEKNTDAEAFARQQFHVDDNNMFVTNFILMNLLEAEALGQIQIDENSFEDALDAILSYQDKNYGSDVPIFSFWPQMEINNTWVAQPQNLYNLVTVFPDLPDFMKKILDRMGLGFFNFVKQLLGAFRIPADNDDSSVNVALRATIQSVKDQHPKLFEKFESRHLDYNKYYQEAVKFAYRPFYDPSQSELKHLDEIDPRTYMYLYKFLDQEYKSKSNPSLLLASTWLMTNETRKPNLYDMPFRVNNVDLTVNANFLFGLSKHLISLSAEEFQSFFQGEIQQMYQDVTRLLKWAIDNDIPSKRPDIALVYYPSVFDFYWFNSRLVKFLDNQLSLPHSDLENARQLLGEALRSFGTRHVIQQKNCDDTHCFWDEFLGDYAGKQRGEDRIFSTSLVLNILLDSWTQQRDQVLTWRDGVSSEVKEIVTKTAQYLVENYGDNNRLRNAFFSGSMKGKSTFPFYYPANVAQYENGTLIDPLSATELKLDNFNVYFAFKGYVPAEDFEEQLTHKRFGQLPFDFKGFNTEFGFGFPFWSSDAISYSITLLGLSKYNVLE